MAQFQVVVIGAGPAGTALVSALCREGLSVAWCAQNLGEPWVNKYGIWVDELPDGLTDDVFEAIWDEPLVRVAGTTRRLARAYGRIDSEALAAALLDGIEPTLFRTNVVSVDDTGTAVELEDGSKVTGELVFDATGVGKFLEEERPSNVAAQTAYGVLASVSGPPIDADMSLMDFDSTFRDDDGPATFLYAMKLGEHWFLEETVLVGRPPYPIDGLRDLLDKRLAARGVEIVERFEVERCFIPMGTPLPSLDQPVVGFGASAGFVHPASGYSLARSLNTAVSVARTSAKTRESAVVWRSVWPAERVKSRRLYQFGMEALLTMDRAAVERFFDAFFELPDASWQGYLSDTLSPAGVQGVMLRVFARAPMSIRLQLMKAAMGPKRGILLEGMFG